MNKKTAILFNVALVLGLSACGEVKLDDETINKEDIKQDIIEGETDKVSLIKQYNSGSYVIKKDFDDYILETRVNVSNDNKIIKVDFNKLVKFDLYLDLNNNLYYMLDGKLDKDGVMIIPKSYRKLSISTDKKIILPNILDAINVGDLVVGRDDEEISRLTKTSLVIPSSLLAEYSLYEAQMDILSKKIIEDQSTFGIIMEDGKAINVKNLVLNISDEVSLVEEILADLEVKEKSDAKVGYYNKGSYEIYTKLDNKKDSLVNYHLYLLIDEMGNISSLDFEVLNGKDDFDLEGLANLVKMNGSLYALNYVDKKGQKLSLDEVLKKTNNEYESLAYLEGFNGPINYYIELLNQLISKASTIRLNDGIYRVNGNNSYVSVIIEDQKIKDVIYDSFSLEDSSILIKGEAYPLYELNKTYLDSSLEEQVMTLYLYEKDGHYYYAKDYLEFGYKFKEASKLTSEEEASLVRSKAPKLVETKINKEDIIKFNNPYTLDLSIKENEEFSKLLNEALRLSSDKTKSFEMAKVDLATKYKFGVGSFSSISPFKTSMGYPYLNLNVTSSNSCLINIDYIDVKDGKIIFNDTYELQDKDQTKLALSNEYLVKNLDLNLVEALDKYDYKLSSDLEDHILDSNSELSFDFEDLFDEVFLKSLQTRVYEVRNEGVKTLLDSLDYKKLNYIVNLKDRNLNEKLGFVIDLPTRIAPGINLEYRLNIDNKDIRVNEEEFSDYQRFTIYAKDSLTELVNVNLELEVRFKDYDDLSFTTSFIATDLASYASFLIDEFNNFGEVNDLVSIKDNENIYDLYIANNSEKEIILDKEFLFDIILNNISKVKNFTEQEKLELKRLVKDYVSQFIILDYSEASKHLVTSDGKVVFQGDNPFPNTEYNKDRDELYIKNSDVDLQKTSIKLSPNTSKEVYEVKLRLYIDTMHFDDVIDTYGNKFKGTWQVGEPYVDITLRVLPTNLVKTMVEDKLDLSNILNTAYKDIYYDLINLDDLRINGLDIKYVGEYKEENTSSKYEMNQVDRLSFEEFKTLVNDKTKRPTSYTYYVLGSKDEELVKKEIKLNVNDKSKNKLAVVAKFNIIDNDSLKEIVAVLEEVKDTRSLNTNKHEQANDYLTINFYELSGSNLVPFNKKEVKLTSGEEVSLPNFYKIYDYLKKTEYRTVIKNGNEVKEEYYIYEEKPLEEKYKILVSNYSILSEFMHKFSFVIDEDSLYINTSKDKVYDAKILVSVDDTNGTSLVNKKISLDAVTSSKNKLEQSLIDELSRVDICTKDQVDGIPLVLKYSDLAREESRTFKEVFKGFSNVTLRNDLGYVVDLNKTVLSQVVDQIRPDKKKGDTEEIKFTVNSFYQDNDKNMIEGSYEIIFTLYLDQDFHD